MAETIVVRPADLLIDEENPRISEPNVGQNNALKSIAEHLGPKLQALAADIVAKGTNPGDLPFVMSQAGDPGRYTVLEGNRRLAALRVLENPESVGDAVTPSVLKALRRLSRLYQDNPVEAVTCVLVRDREEARHWIELRHTGENMGAGLVPWGSDEVARFRARTRGASEPHIQALDFLQERGLLTTAQRRKVPASSLKRLIGTPEVRAKLGVELVDGIMRFRAVDSKVATALLYVVKDLSSGNTNSRAINTTGQRVAYAAALPSNVAVSPTIKSGLGAALGGREHGAPKSTTKKAASRTKKRDRLIPKDCALSIPVERIRDIEGELRHLSLEDHTNAVSVLFRVFMELSADAYISDHPEIDATNDSKLRVKIERVASHLEHQKKLTKQQGHAIRSASTEHSFLAPTCNTMNDYVHNEHIFPAPSDLRQHWNNLQPFIKGVWTG